jgi:Zn-dependent peptidase ImmA (M78 family)
MDATLELKDIDEKTKSLLEAVFGDINSLRLPVDLNRIADYFNLTIKQGTFEDADIEGALDRSTGTVFLSENDGFEDKNFTLAHEIGHYKLHEELERDIFTMHQLKGLLERQGKDQREDQADHFAASLMMPKGPVLSLWSATSKDIDMIAKIFGVPKVVAIFRLKALKLL